MDDNEKEKVKNIQTGTGFVLGFLIFWIIWGSLGMLFNTETEPPVTPETPPEVIEVVEYSASIILLDMNEPFIYKFKYDDLIESKVNSVMYGRYLSNGTCILEYSGDVVKIKEPNIVYRGNYVIDCDDIKLETEVG